MPGKLRNGGLAPRPFARRALTVACVSILAFSVAGQASAHAAHGKRHDLIKAMNENGCALTPDLAKTVLPELKLDTEAAMTMIGNMIAEGIAAFASDDKTLLLLQPECKA